MAGAKSSRPELLAACRLQRPTDDGPARAGHPDPFLICPAIPVLHSSGLIKERGQLGWGRPAGSLADVGRLAAKATHKAWSRGAWSLELAHQDDSLIYVRGDGVGHSPRH